jgi:hypothetical protein
MVFLRDNCLILDGVICRGENRRFCPRANYTFWRDIWVNKVPPPRAVLDASHAPSNPRPAVLHLTHFARSSARFLGSVGTRFVCNTLVFQHVTPQHTTNAAAPVPGATWHLADPASIRGVFAYDPKRRNLFLHFLQSGCLGLLLLLNNEWIAYGWTTQPKSGRPHHLPHWAERLGASWIFYCHTKVSFCGLGIYKPLFAHIVALARESGSRPVYIDALPEDVTSRRAILASGFSPCGVTTTFKLWLPGIASIPLAGSWSIDTPHPGSEANPTPNPADTLAIRY